MGPNILTVSTGMDVCKRMGLDIPRKKRRVGGGQEEERRGRPKLIDHPTCSSDLAHWQLKVSRSADVGYHVWK